MAIGDRAIGQDATPVGKTGTWWVFASADKRGVEVRRSTGSKPLAHLTPADARELADLLVMAASASERLAREEV